MKRRTKLGLSIIIILAVAAGMRKLPGYIQEVAVRTLEERTGRRVFSEKVRYNYLTSTLYLENFKIMEANEEDTFISFDSFNIDIDPMKLIFKTLFIQEITLVNPSLRIEQTSEGINYAEIMENWKESQEKNPGEEVAEEVDPFLKRIELENITIESFTLYYQDEVITADNNFTFKTPKLTYGDNLFQLSSKLDFLDGSYLDIDFHYNDSTTEFGGGFKGEKIELDDKLFLPKKILELSKLSGEVSLDLEVQGKIAGNSCLISGKSSITNLDILNKQEKRLLSMDRGRITFPQLDLFNSNFHIEELSLDGFLLNQGELLEHLTSISTPSKEESEGGTLPQIAIERLSIGDSVIETPLASLEEIDLTLENFGTYEGRSKVDLSLSLNRRTPVKIGGTISKERDLKVLEDLEELGFKGRVRVTTLDLREVNTISQEIPYELSGLMNIDSYLTYSGDSIRSRNTIFLEELNVRGKTSQEEYSMGSGTGILNLSLKEMRDYTIDGEVILNSLKASLVEGRPLFQGEEIRVSMDEVTQDRVAISSVSLTNPKVTLWEKEDSQNPTDEPSVEEGKTSGMEEKKAGDTSKLPLLLLKNLQVDGGRVDLIEEDFKYTLKDIEVAMKDFTSERDREFTLLLEGGLTGLGRFKSESAMSLVEDWDFTATGLNVDGRFNISNLDLVDFNPILKKNLPNEIKSGRVFYQGEIKMDAGSFRGENVIRVKNIHPGESTGNNPALPLKLGINLLKDRNNNLLLDVPVYGDFNDPQFRIYRVVLQAMKNLIVRAAASPLTMITKTLGLSEERVSTISYDYLSSELTEDEAKKLDEISKVLELKDGVEVKLVLFTDLEREMDILNERLKEEKIFKTSTKREVLEGEVRKVIQGRRENLLQYFRSKFLEEKVSVESSEVLRSKPQSQVEFIFN
ncbi:hypothetical protein PM10SUCC1_18250 [Propionigenium maris DSM 9537]|uniref:DUF748 domain-containing protein n=1 Tax=Propionigenium maris DSM 9537 TaxID=1123000 RepID=A0A9W6LMG6_9FUSO|nr:DUF748 domain-containing protein [Propionigenium maris]GLI56311.1 hypothetical protein PM10SUCC1_18250 [Propionigenium maris DSM 9537]